MKLQRHSKIIVNKLYKTKLFYNINTVLIKKCTFESQKKIPFCKLPLHVLLMKPEQFGSMS